MNSIKKIITISLACIFTLSFSSCTKDEDPTPVITPTPNQLISSNSLVGSWIMSGLNYAGSSTTSVGGINTTTQFSAVGRDFTYTVQYSDNPKTYTTFGGYTVAITSLLNGSTFTQDASIPNAIASGTWSLNGNELTVTDNSTNQSSTSTILSSANNNDFSVDFAGFSGQSLQGANVKFTSGTVTYKRQ